nr:hypothetical protein OH826_12160 [Streptomyces sp. NBC_00899]
MHVNGEEALSAGGRVTGRAPRRRPGLLASKRFNSADLLRTGPASRETAQIHGPWSDVGFTATYRASNAAPSAFTLNGAGCTT